MEDPGRLDRGSEPLEFRGPGSWRRGCRTLPLWRSFFSHDALAYSAAWRFNPLTTLAPRSPHPRRLGVLGAMGGSILRQLPLAPSCTHAIVRPLRQPGEGEQSRGDGIEFAWRGSGKGSLRGGGHPAWDRRSWGDESRRHQPIRGAGGAGDRGAARGPSPGGARCGCGCARPRSTARTCAAAGNTRRPPDAPADIPGLEFAARSTRSGRRSSELAVGRSGVRPRPAAGRYAEQIVVHARTVAKDPRAASPSPTRPRSPRRSSPPGTRW